MTPYYADEFLTVFQGDCREVMRSMEPESVHCVVTSPPYWGLRDYGTSGQLGLEATPEEYVANLVDVFREVRRVLRADGTVWLNLGDSYAGGGTSPQGLGGQMADRAVAASRAKRRRNGLTGGTQTVDVSLGGVLAPGLKPKDLVGIPWRVAFALQADGWYLRSDIIWAKPNPMPESVTDRPTKSHEYLFLLSKSPRYYFDADAVREAQSELTAERYAYGFKDRYAEEGVTGAIGYRGPAGGQDGYKLNPGGRNLRSVWTIATQPYPGAHFATFPRKLVEPCIKAGTSERGVCPECGAPWVRVVERAIPSSWEERKAAGARGGNGLEAARENGARHQQPQRGSGVSSTLAPVTNETRGWRPSCECVGCGCDMPGCTGACHAGLSRDPVPATVLDPFAGSGTTGLVAQALGRRAILIDLATDYLGQIMARNAQKPLGLAG